MSTYTMRLSIGILMRSQILLDLAIVTEDHSLDDTADELLRPHAEQNALRSPRALGRGSVPPSSEGPSILCTRFA